MNIFVLDPNPQKAALAHCDQHLHKMILESAQMLSTAAHIHFPQLKGHIYAPAYQNHPCTVWTCANLNHMVWLCALADSLECIRENKGCNRHSSMDVIKAIYDNLPGHALVVQEFAEAMYPHIKIRQDLSTVEKYQLYYRKKHLAWLLTGKRGMSYKDRPAPDFMKDLIVS
jgi:hypothetical protein